MAWRVDQETDLWYLRLAQPDRLWKQHWSHQWYKEVFTRNKSKVSTDPDSGRNTFDKHGLDDRIHTWLQELRERSTNKEHKS